MTKRTVAAIVLTVGALLLLTGCMGQWFSQNNYRPALVVGRPIVTGRVGKVLIAVTNMPQEGVAAIAIADHGISYTNIIPTSIKVEGMNGFVVLAQDFTTTAGKGRLAAANPNAGVPGGTILKITFKTTGAAPTFTITAAKVSLGSALNTLITNWELSTNKAYYAKDASQSGGAR